MTPAKIRPTPVYMSTVEELSPVCGSNCVDFFLVLLCPLFPPLLVDALWLFPLGLPDPLLVDPPLPDPLSVLLVDPPPVDPPFCSSLSVSSLS